MAESEGDPNNDVVAAADAMSSADPPAADGVGPTSPSIPERSGRTLTQNVSVLFFTQIVTWAISLSLVVVMPRFLGPAGIGQLQIVESVWAVGASLAAFGTQTVVTLEIARDPERGSRLIGAAMMARVLMFAVIAGVVAVLVASGYGRDFPLLFVVAGITMFISNISGVAVAALQGFEDMSLTSRAGIVHKLFNAVAIITVLVLGGGVLAIVCASAVSSVVSAAVLYRYLRRYTDTRLTSSLPEATHALRLGVPFFLGGVIMVVYHEIDTFIISILLDETQVGWYAAADRLTSASMFVPTVVMGALFPVLARLSHEDESAAKQVVDEGFRSLIIFSIPIGIGIVILSTPMVTLLFGSDFAESGPVFGVFGVVLMIMFQTILVGQYAVTAGRQAFYFSLAAIATVATIPIDLVLVPWTNRTFDNGAIGGAMAYVITEGAILVVSLRVVAPHVVNTKMFVRLAKCALGAGVMTAAILPLREVFFPIPIALGAVVYAVVTILVRTFDAREIDAGRRLVHSATRGRIGSG